MPTAKGRCSSFWVIFVLYGMVETAEQLAMIAARGYHDLPGTTSSGDPTKEARSRLWTPVGGLWNLNAVILGQPMRQGRVPGLTLEAHLGIWDQRSL